MRIRSRREWLFNAWLTALLLVGAVVLGNRLAKDHLRLRLDLSEEQLFAPSPVADEMLGSLEDLLQVKAFFTGDVKHGPVQLAKSRLLDQLREYEDAARGRMEVVFADPNGSSEVRLEAQRYGIEPVPLRAVQGTSELTQEVFLGLLLRYRGREAVLPFVLPQSFSYAFLAELSVLVREREISVGFLAGAGSAESVDDFGEARRLLSGRYRVRELVGLADGSAVPDDVQLVVVARPTGLHPRAAFALDQFVQRGGRLLLCLERVRIDLNALQAALVESGLESMLAAWGVEVTPELAWDQEANWLSISGVGRSQYPFWVNVGEGGMEPEVPVTGQLPGADFFWVHPLATSAVEGLAHTSLVRSSEDSWPVDAGEALETRGEGLNTRGVELLATEPGRPLDLAVAVAGRFPSAFASGAPAARDAIAESLWSDAVRRALEEGREPPAREITLTDEDVLTGGEGGTVVVLGDADWASDGKFFTARNQLLFENLVDWLCLEDELIALRAKRPRERRIVDLLAEEKERRGLPTLEGSGALALEGVDPKLLAEAEAAAERRRWLFMATATGASLLLAVGLAFGGRFLLNRGGTA
ncbi:MAG: GldG family protein [Planctomycetota bacterium]